MEVYGSKEEAQRREMLSQLWELENQLHRRRGISEEATLELCFEGSIKSNRAKEKGKHHLNKMVDGIDRGGTGYLFQLCLG